MYPAPSDGGIGRNFNCALWPLRGPLCRPRFVKLLLVVVLLMMAQFSLNILFYRNHDSLFYVNSTSAVSLASFESRVSCKNTFLFIVLLIVFLFLCILMIKIIQLGQQVYLWELVILTLCQPMGFGTPAKLIPKKRCKPVCT